MRLSASQISAGLALARMTQDDLASATGIWRPTLTKILNDESVAREETLRKIHHALEARGIEFIGNIGVQWAQHQIRTLTGVEGLKTFFDDVRSTVKKSDEEIVISGIEESYLENKLGTYLDHHRQEMAAHGGVKMRCLIREGDSNVGASDYCQYRWQLKQQFVHVPFYVYGDKLAIIVASGPEDPMTLLIQNRTIVEAYRLQFEIMWDASQEIATVESNA
jgi:transcriptional regulator with XRE-family HTH domain